MHTHYAEGMWGFLPGKSAEIVKSYIVPACRVTMSREKYGGSRVLLGADIGLTFLGRV